MSIIPEREIPHKPAMTAVVHTIISNLYTIEVRVEYQGTTWNAEFYDPIDQTALVPGQRVKIVARDGNTLLIVGPTTGY